MNLKFWAWDLWTYRRQLRLLTGKCDAIAKFTENIRRDRDALLKTKQKLTQLRSDMARAKPMSEEELLRLFTASGDPIFAGVLQVIDESYDTVSQEVRDGKNTVAETDMARGGLNVLAALKLNLLEYAARARAEAEKVKVDK